MNPHLKEHRCAQISIEFVAGFLFFIIAILYVVFSMIDNLPQYHEEGRNVIMHEAVWFASQKAMDYASAGGDLNVSVIRDFANCNVYASYKPGSDEFINGVGNYTLLKSDLGIDETMGFYMNVKSFSILVSNASSGINHTGQFNIDGTSGPFEIFNYTPGIYDGLHIGTSYSGENEIVTIASKDYTVEKIDPSGNFAILSKTLADCGARALRGKTTAVVKRYATYNGSVAKMEMMLWA